MRLIRRLFLLLCFAATCGAVWAAVHARREGFSQSWRNAIEREFESRGYHVEIGKLTLGAFRGLVAEDVRFFQDASRRQEIAYLDDVYLDVDLSRILDRKQVSINTLDVQEASLSLPLDPSRPGGRRLRVTGLSGRVVVTESVIEILKAEASVAGIDLVLKGSLVRPPVGEGETRPKRRNAADEEALAERRRQLVAFLREFENYEFEGGRPRAEIEFRGDLEAIETLSAEAKVSVPAFGKRGQPYRVESLGATLRFDGRTNRAEIEGLRLRDAKGALDLSGQWTQEKGRLDFSLDSGADVAGLAALFWSGRKEFGEVVFFSPPTIRASGHLDFARLGEPGFPGSIIGELRAERFVTRGSVFAGVNGGFSIEGDRVYVRNLRLDHKTGVAFLNLKYEPGGTEETLQYQTEIKLDPLVFRPFLNERGRQYMDAWNFGEKSSIYIAAVGQGENWDFSTWKNRGVIDLRHFQLNGVDFLELETEYESDRETQWFRNARLVREEGSIVAEVAENDRSKRRWEVKGVVSTVDPVEGARAFNAKLAESLSRYRHDSPPTIRLSGQLDARRADEIGDAPRRNSVKVAFSGGGDARYDFLGKTLTFADPVGEVVVEGSRVHLTSLTGGIFGGRIGIAFDAKNVRDPAGPFEMEIRAEGVPLEKVTGHYGEAGNATGAIDAAFRIAGNHGRVETFGGGGEMRISEGSLFSIPVLGPLSKLIPTPRNGAGGGGNVAKEASAAFRLDQGVLQSDNIEALTPNFRVKAAGSISLVDQSVDLEAVVNTRDVLSSTVLTPVSELLTYSCSGTIREPVWKPKHITNLVKVPTTLVSELTNIPVEGLKMLGQLGQGILSLPERAAEGIESLTNGNQPSSPARDRSFPWAGRQAEGTQDRGPAPRKLLPSLTPRINSAR
jgi:hypothetical protein